MLGNKLTDQHPELEHSSRYDQEHRQRQQQRSGMGVLILLGIMNQIVGHVLTAIPLAGIVAAFCLKFIPGVYVVYCLSFTGTALAALFFWVANTFRQGQNLFTMGLGWGTLDALFYLFGAVFAVTTLYGVTVVFIRKMSWVSKIVALFFVYNLAVWWNHGFQLEATPVGAYFFCFVLTLFAEGGPAIWEHQKLRARQRAQAQR
jgi:hypothetical protein